MSNRGKRQRFWQEHWFWLALLAGPIWWLTLYLQGASLSQRPPSWELILWVGLLYPILEEFVFRGGLQVWLTKYHFFQRSRAGFSLANVLTSVVFSSAHLLNQSAEWAVLIMVPSLIFGWMRDRYASITPGVLLHIVYNLGLISLFATH